MPSAKHITIFMKNYFSTDFKLGILGGGQLGKMLLTETRKYDIHTLVLDPSKDAPGKLAANEFYTGNLTDFKTVYNFGKKADVLTIEIENVNVDALKKLQEEGVKVFPQPEVLEIIQDKAVQKQFYKDHKIPTSDFEAFSNKQEVLNALQNNWKYPAVWKASTGGYDGFGVAILKSENDLAKIGDQPGILEKLVPFEKELGIVVARNQNGETACFTAVEMEFHPTANQVEYVLSPANISTKVEQEAERIAINVAQELNICGLLAVELFLTKNGEILVNEAAPRTHNSGHLTIESSYTSQFEQHLRAILNLPLGSTKTKTPAVMVNLVGEEGFTGNVIYQGFQELMKEPGVNIHIYGKKETRPFRKMGHVTIIGDTIKEARALAEKAKNAIRVISEK